MKIALRPFAESDFSRLIEWIRTPELLVQWAGPTQFTFPLTTGQLTGYLEESRSDRGNRRAYAAIDENGDVAGHIELGAIDHVNQSATLCRVFVAPQARRKGYCLPMVKEILRIGFEELNLRRVDLRVYSFNEAAIRCYKGAGFREEGLLKKAQKVGEQYWDTVLMAILHEEWNRAETDKTCGLPIQKRLTDRLVLLAATIDLARAELESPQRLASMLNAQVPDGWPPGEYDRAAQELFLGRLEAGGAGAIGWHSWYAVLRGTSEMPPVLVGAGGFHGPPDEAGVVEIGYSVMPAWQGQGLAGEMVDGLVDYAFADHRVHRIVAHTTTENAASCKVLECAGFRQVGPGEEPGSLRFETSRTRQTPFLDDAKAKS